MVPGRKQSIRTAKAARAGGSARREAGERGERGGRAGEGRCAMFPCHPPSRRRWARPPAPACLRNSRKRAISSQTGGDSGPAGPPHTPPAARARAPRPPVRQPLPAPRAQLQGPGAGVLARPEWRLRAPPVPAAGLERGGGGVLLAVAEERLAGPRGGSSGLNGGYPRARTVCLWRGGSRGDVRPALVCNSPGGPRRPLRAARGLPAPVTAAAGRPGSSRGGREEHPPLAAAAAQLSERRPGSLWVSGYAAVGLRGDGGRGVVPAQPPAGRRGPGTPQERPRASQPPSSPPPPPLIWRAREAQLGAPAPARERPAPPAQLTRGSRNAEPSLARPRAPAPCLTRPRTPTPPAPGLGAAPDGLPEGNSG
nr:collagen alpha-1(I) chain [Marmota flaviventris]